MRRFISLLALCAFIPSAAHAGGLQPGSGWLQLLESAFGRYSWSLGNDFSFDSNNGPDFAPEYCVGVCSYNFSNSFFGVGNSADFTFYAVFQFGGPSVEATATCSPAGCPPGDFRTVYATNWADVPITITGQVDLVSRVDPRVVFH